MLFRIPLEELTGGPFDCQEVHTRCGFADLNGLHDIWMLYAFSVACFAHKSGNSRFVLAKFLAQDLDGNDSMGGVLSAEDSGCSALPYFATQCISRQGPTYQVL